MNDERNIPLLKMPQQQPVFPQVAVLVGNEQIQINLIFAPGVATVITLQQAQIEQMINQWQINQRQQMQDAALANAVMKEKKKHKN